MRSSLLGAIAFAVPLSLTVSALYAGELRMLAQPVDAPSLSLPDMRDQTHTLTDYRGRVVLVNFWASWCPPCVIELPGLQRLAERIGKDDFALLAVNVGENKHRARRALTMTAFEQTVLLDTRSEAYDRWGASVFPTSYLIDKTGRIRLEAVGPLDWEGDEAVTAIEALIAEAPLPAATTSADAECYAEAPPNPKGCQP